MPLLPARLRARCAPLHRDDHLRGASCAATALVSWPSIPKSTRSPCSSAAAIHAISPRAARAGEEAGYDEINLNCGCPSERVASGAFGACLMLEPARVADCVAAMRAAVRIPVTVKMRIGVISAAGREVARSRSQYNEEPTSRRCVRFRRRDRGRLGARSRSCTPARRCSEDCRPRTTARSRRCATTVVRRLKRAFPQLPVIVNGGLRDVRAVLEALSWCDGVMLGREAYHRPFVLAELQRALAPQGPPAPSREALSSAWRATASASSPRASAWRHRTTHAWALRRRTRRARFPADSERRRAPCGGGPGAVAARHSSGRAALVPRDIARGPASSGPGAIAYNRAALMGKDIELAILFADVVGSTRLYDLMGDLRARDMVATCIEVMRSATEQRQGTVIKTMGDEVMATFPTADAALNAAAQMQQQISAHAELKVDGQPVSIRIGCHFGPVMLENRDVFGAAVHTANRMTSQAKAGQIITTAATVERLSPEWRAPCRQIDIATLKGQGNEVALYEVLWQTEDVTSMVPGIAIDLAPGAAPCACGCACEDRDLWSMSSIRSITIGRAEDNDVVVKGNLISRLHARIEISRNKFVLIDQSTNGTFVQTADGEEAFVRRDSLQIKGQGMIGLGRLPEQGSPQTIRFNCEEN